MVFETDISIRAFVVAWEKYPPGSGNSYSRYVAFELANLKVASSEEVTQSTGGYWANMRKVSASAKVHDEQLQQKIIEKTNQALGF